jgi:hypothetical protein
LSCSAPPKGYARWTLRLLEKKVVELEIVEAARDSTIGRVLKKRMARPVCKQLYRDRQWSVCFNVFGFGESSQPRWRFARSGPHNILGVERRFFNQVSRTPFDCQAISLSPPANIIGRSVCDHALIGQ